jgi:hypothetical protein
VIKSNRQVSAVREPLQLRFPEPKPGLVATTGFGGDQQLGGFAVARSSNDLPPTADGIGGEARRVVIQADTDPTFCEATPSFCAVRGHPLCAHPSSQLFFDARHGWQLLALSHELVTPFAALLEGIGKILDVTNAI